ncbi:hypothetical protein B0H10DRAFT_326738 [Mycena sp. CBHHK59/15]|nr:hypothetical protein B0H10DRAFT_326738 [Mycena sp. CBHHK59/15]
MDHSPTIPLELVDLILDFLHSDDDTLSACTLVCKSWLPSARFHLLSRIALHTSNADSFLDEVEIVSAQVHEDMMLPKFIATGLMNVTSLRIDGLDLSTVPPALPFSFPKLECLCLEGFEAKSFGVIALWISGFPLLRSLKLAGDWDGDEIETPIVARIPELLHTLDVNCPLKVLFEWLLSLPVVPVTSSLVLRDIWTEESSTISRYLAVAGSSLRSLTVVYPRKEVICLDLKQNTCLQTLSWSPTLTQWRAS